MTAGWGLGEEAARIREIASGNDEAWTAMHAQYGRVVFWHALLRTRRREAAEDLVQEAYCRAHIALQRAFREGDPLPVRLLPWLLRIVGNLATDEERRSRTTRHGGAAQFVDIESAAGVPDRSSDPEDRLDCQRVFQAIDGLPRLAQLSVCLFLFEGLSGRAIARELKISKQKVFRALDGGLTQIRSQLGADHG